MQLRQRFLPDLKDHLLERLLSRHGQLDDDTPDFTDRDRFAVFIVNDQLYEHQTLQVNYTTYDARRDQDTINPRTHADVMFLSRDNPSAVNAHPYLYAQVLKIFHLRILHTGPSSRDTGVQEFDVLWVRWFQRDVSYGAGWDCKRLHRLSFFPGRHPDAFGFVDPNDVIRSSHLIPAFAHGKTAAFLPLPSVCRLGEDKDNDWKHFYINM